MKLSGAKKQTLFVTAVNAVVRALGLLMRMLLSRMLGAEMMGIAELAQSVHMAAIAPLTSGLPVAISRLTAKAAPHDRLRPLQAGLKIVRCVSLVLIPLMWLLSPWLARITGDLRVLPSLWFTTPCILVLGCSAVYNGYCYGTEQSVYPAVSELIEQAARLGLTLVLLSALRWLSMPWMAAIPVAATLVAEIIGLIYVCSFIRLAPDPAGSHKAWIRPILRLSLPTTLSRLVQTLLRSVTAILIPLRLQQSGLQAAEATARLGMLNGMVMPFLMLPCVFTSALSMVSLPKLAKAEEKPGELRRILGLCLAALLPSAAICCILIALAAPFLSVRLYRLAELTSLFRVCAPMALLFSLNHLTGSVLSALGLQKQSMYASSLVAVITLFLTWFWAGDPKLRLTGVVMAQYAGQLFSLLAALFIFWRWHISRQAR